VRHFNENPNTIIKRASHPTGKQHQIKHDSNLEKLPQSAQKELDVINKTKDNTQMTLTLALSYGSRGDSKC
jgi:undecaprenyl pyrophosphate synthase